MAFDQESYYARNRWGSIHIPPYRDLRQEPAPKPRKWPVVALCGVATVLMLVAVVAPT